MPISHAFSPALLRAESLLEPGMPEKLVEVIEGELSEMTPAGRRHNRVAIAMQTLFWMFCREKPELECGGDNDGFLLERDPDVLLRPDVSIFPSQPETDRPWLDVAPLIAVEVLSPSNSAAEIAYKRGKYLSAGCLQVWVADPKQKSLEIAFADGRRARFEGAQVVNGEGPAEGLEIDLESIFAPKRA